MRNVIIFYTKKKRKKRGLMVEWLDLKCKQWMLLCVKKQCKGIKPHGQVQFSFLYVLYSRLLFLYFPCASFTPCLKLLFTHPLLILCSLVCANIP